MAVIHSLGEFPLINLQFDRGLTPSAGILQSERKGTIRRRALLCSVNDEDIRRCNLLQFCNLAKRFGHARSFVLWYLRY